MNILPATAVRENWRQALQQTETEPVIITQFGKAKAVLLDFDIYQKMVQALEDHQDRQTVRAAIAELKTAGSPQAAGYLPWDEASRDL